MDTNDGVAPMDTNINANDGKLILKEEVYAIVGCAFAVLNELGHCGKEKIYENALCVEMKLKGLHFSLQPRYTVMYKGKDVGLLIPDLVVYECVIVDTKVVPEITDRERWQILNYLRVTSLRVGILLNFYRPKLEWERLVL